MSSLTRKVIRDIAYFKGQFAAIVAVVCIGVAMLVGLYSPARNLDESLDRTYDELGLADFTVALAPSPASAVRKAAAVDGVRRAEGRISMDLPLDLPGSDGRKGTARIISMQGGEHPPVNDVLVVSGRYLPEGESLSLLVEKHFADYYGLDPGDRLSLTIDGRKTPLTICGIACSPEYIWPVKSSQEFTLSAREFAVLFVSHETAGSLFHMTGQVNEIVGDVLDPSTAGAAVEEVEEALDRYGVRYAMEWTQYPSYKYMEMELSGLRQMAVMLPILFLSVAAVVLYILMLRMVNAQRRAIGVMRALGYSRGTVLLHYTSHPALVGAAAGALGSGAGYAMSVGLTGYYTRFFVLPHLVIRPHWEILAAGFAVSVASCAIGGLVAARTAAATDPAEAMRPPVPASGGRSVFERVLPLLSRLSLLWKIALRNLERNRARTVYASLGVVFAMALLVVCLGLFDVSLNAFDSYFDRFVRYDVKASFSTPAAVRDVSHLGRRLDGVSACEPMLEVPVKLRNGAGEFTTVLRATVRESDLSPLYRSSESTSRVPLPRNGIALSSHIVHELGLETGDPVEVEPLLRDMDPVTMPLAFTIDQPIGTAAYGEIEYVCDRLGIPTCATSALLGLDGTHGAAESVRDALEESSNVTLVEESGDIRADFEEYMTLTYSFIGIALLFGGTVAFAILYNINTVNLMEQRTELATMRVLGFRHGQVVGLFALQNLAILLLALLPGALLGKYLAAAYLQQMSGELFTLTGTIPPDTYVISAIAVGAACFLGMIPAVRHLGRMDLEELTREQE